MFEGPPGEPGQPIAMVRCALLPLACWRGHISWLVVCHLTPAAHLSKSSWTLSPRLKNEVTITECITSGAELQSMSGLKPAEVQDAVCSKAMAVCGVVARYGAVPLPDGKPATVDTFLARLIRQALALSFPPILQGLCLRGSAAVASTCCLTVTLCHLGPFGAHFWSDAVGPVSAPGSRCKGHFIGAL